MSIRCPGCPSGARGVHQEPGCPSGAQVFIRCRGCPSGARGVHQVPGVSIRFPGCPSSARVSIRCPGVHQVPGHSPYFPGFVFQQVIISCRDTARWHPRSCICSPDEGISNIKTLPPVGLLPFVSKSFAPPHPALSSYDPLLSSQSLLQSVNQDSA